jgi:very-short-patch-repair endonuclease
METNDALIKAGWEVLRLWEHDIDVSAERCACKVVELVARRRSRTEREK